MVDLALAIETCKWAEFEAWLDAHNLLIQHHEVEGDPHLEGEMSVMKPPRVQARQSQALMERSKAKFLSL